jgi:hypothetical protein
MHIGKSFCMSDVVSMYLCSFQATLSANEMDCFFKFSTFDLSTSLNGKVSWSKPGTMVQSTLWVS